MKKANNNASLILAMLAIGFGAQTFAQEDPLLSETDNIVNTGQIDITGLYAQKKVPTQSDRLKQARKNLELKSERMMAKKVEDARIAQELELARKLEHALAGQLAAVSSMDTVSTVSAAPVMAAHAPVVAVEDNMNSVTLSGGFMNIASEKNQLDTNLSLKISMESRVHPRVSIGMGIRYASVDMTNNNLGTFNNLGTINTFGSYNTQGVNNGYNNSNREIQYRQLSLSGHSKFFFSTKGKIRPYAGGALSYNRGSYKYDQQQATGSIYQAYPTNLNNDGKVSANNLSAVVMLGTEIRFSNQFSAQVSAEFERAITSGVAQDNINDTTDQQQLKALALDIESANIASVNVGFSFNF